MFALLHSLTMFVIDFFKSPRRLEIENLFLRHQLSIALRRAPPRLRLRGSDRALVVWMTRLWPSLLGAAKIVQLPQTGKDRRPPYLLTCRGLRHVRQRVLPAGGRKHASCSLLRWWCWHRINTTQLLLAV